MAKHYKKKKQRFSPALPLLLIAVLLSGVFIIRRGAGGKKAEPTAVPTATAAPAPSPTPTPEPTPSPYEGTTLRISEVCCVNVAMVRDEDGDFGDWIELENFGSEAVDLSGWAVSDKQNGGWRFGSASVPAGERMLVFCDGKDRQGGENHTDFSLRAGETVFLLDPAGDVRDSLSTEGAEKGQSAARLADGSVSLSRFVTPGYENSEEGYAAWQESLELLSPLVINECVCSNADSFAQYSAVSGELEYYDWVEIRNVSNENVSTDGYYLSDNTAEPKLWAIPARTLFPGECWTFQCAGDESLTERYFTHTNFKLDNEAEGVYLFAPDGSLADWLYVHDVPCRGSIGRQTGKSGAFFMERSTPHKENGQGFRLFCTNPEALTPDGVFNGVESVSVELSADRPIYYTTDGSVPTLESELYTGPITLTKTSVIRAMCCEEGKLACRPLSLSYIINENHDLPVASIVTENGNLFGGGIYDRWADFDGRQVPASLSLYDGDDAFTVDCGLKMFGHTGLKNAKKSMKVLFRSRFGSESFTHDIYGDGNDTFTSLVLRAGQDCYFSVIRDELFQSLSADLSDRVLVQRNKYCALYINGKYWGLYALKDAYSEDYYAALRGVSVESVEKVQAPVAVGSEFYRDVLTFGESSDMSVAENYELFCSRVDIDSLIDWAIIEGYSANADVQQNLRYFRSSENGNKWEYAFYDLDWAFYYENNLDFVFHGIGEDGSVLQHTRYIAPLLRNAEFCDRFCTCLAEALEGPLSEEAVLRKIDELCAEIENEVPRDHARWSMGGWESKVDQLRDFVRNDWTRKIIDGAVEFCQLTEAEREAYFGNVVTD